MKNKIILGIAIVLIIGVGGFAVMMLGKKPASTNQSANKDTQKTTQTKSGEIEATLKSLLTGGKSVKCTFSNEYESIKMTGTTYVNNGKMRSDYTTTLPEGETNGHIIVDGKTSYLWSDDNSQGMKIVMDDKPVSITPVQGKGFDINQSMKFNCDNWRADNSMFTLPTNVTFSEFNIPTIPASKPTVATTTDDEKQEAADSDQCAACNNVPEGAARDACKTALNCQ